MKKLLFTLMPTTIVSLLVGCATSSMALHEGIVQDNEQVIVESLGKGANPNDVANYGDDYTKPALMLAVEKGDVDTVKVLLAGGANTEARFTRDHNQTILQRAVLFGHIDVIRVLLAKGAKINAKDGNKCTALDEAQGFRIDSEIRKLLKASGGRCGCGGICN